LLSWAHVAQDLGLFWRCFDLQIGVVDKLWKRLGSNSLVSFGCLRLQLEILEVAVTLGDQNNKPLLCGCWVE
jgi:hypothetical protein